jgi:hypothetical protein
MLLIPAFFLLNVCWKLKLANSFAPELLGFERNVIWGIQHLMGTGNLYSNPDAEPFALIQYMPLYYYTISGIASSLHLEPGQVHSIYQVARNFNLVAGLATVLILFFILRRSFQMGLLKAALFSMLAFLVLPSFTISARPDSFKALIFTMNVALALQMNQQRIRYFLPVSIVLSLMGFLCKQDGLTALGIMPLAFLLGKEWRNFFTFSLAGAAALIALIFALHFWGTGWFLGNALGALQNGISIMWFKGVFLNFFAHHSVFFVPALVLAYEFSKEKNRKFRILAAAFFVAFFPPLLASLKFGSGGNYFIEAMLVSFLFLALAYRPDVKIPLFRLDESRILLPLFGFILWFFVPAIEWSVMVFFGPDKFQIQQYNSDKQIALELRQQLKGKQIMLLTSRQWEDYLTTMLWDRVINPTRDVSEQVFQGSDGGALKSLKRFVVESNSLALITRSGQKPSFPGMDFSRYKPAMQAGEFQVWMK